MIFDTEKKIQKIPPTFFTFFCAELSPVFYSSLKRLKRLKRVLNNLKRLKRFKRFKRKIRNTEVGAAGGKIAILAM